MEEKVMKILAEIYGAEDGEMEADMDLFEMGALDSFGVVQLLVELEEQLGVTLEMELLSREDIATPSKIAELIMQARAI